jgi:hypothetical protein
MERPTADPSKTLALRYDLANLRVQRRQLQHDLEELDKFEQVWEEFVRGLGEGIRACQEKRLSFWDPQLDLRLKLVETLRLDLAGRQYTVLTELSDPMGKFLHTSVLVPSKDLLTLFFVVDVDQYGTVRVPIGDFDEERYEASETKFERNAAEARVEITRRRRRLQADETKLTIMLEEAQRAQDEANKFELDKIKAARLMPLVVARLKDSKVGKIVWWLGEEPLKKALIALLVALAAISPARHWVAGLFHRLLSGQ